MAFEKFTDHSTEIALLRLRTHDSQGVEGDRAVTALAYLACAELLRAHDETGISLDDWQPVRALVEYCIGRPIDENGV